MRRADFNRRFAVPARSAHDMHRPLLPSDNLDLILTRQKTGVLSKNLTVQYNKIIYQIQTERPTYALQKAPVTICENPKGEVTILYKNQPLSYTTYKKLAPQAEVLDTKQLHRTRPFPKPPASDHPWRTYGKHLNGKPIPESPPAGSD